MKDKALTLLLAAAFLLPLVLRAQVGELPRVRPETQGVPSRAVAELFDSLMALPRTDIHSVLVMRHGAVVGEMYPAPFAPKFRHTMYSCSKTFVGAAVGLAIADNRLRLTDRVGAFFPELLPDTVSPDLARLTVRDLLTMTSGITPDWSMRSLTPDWIKTYLAKPVAGVGTKFQYDSIATYLLSALVQRATGMTLLDYLRAKLFTPLHITEVDWELSPEGYNTGGWGLHIQTESLAKFGQLLLDGGKWHGRQLLPADWVKSMMTEQQPGTGYGFQMWQCEYPGAWRADGALGQYILVIPDKDMVVVITECTLIDGARQRRLVWDKLLPALSDAPLPPADRDFARLQRKQSTYTLPLPEGKPSSPLARPFEGKRIRLEANKYGWQTLEWQPAAHRPALQLKVTTDHGQCFTLDFGYRQWLTTPVDVCPPYSISPIGAFTGIPRPFHASGSYAWPEPDVLRLQVHYVDWVSALGLELRFDGTAATLTVRENYSSAPQILNGTFE